MTLVCIKLRIRFSFSNYQNCKFLLHRNLLIFSLIITKRSALIFFPTVIFYMKAFVYIWWVRPSAKKNSDRFCHLRNLRIVDFKLNMTIPVTVGHNLESFAFMDVVILVIYINLNKYEFLVMQRYTSTI